MSNFVWSDVWLFLAIALGNSDGGSSLKSIIANGDALNHAIFTDAELESGLCRLTTSELIVERNGLFFLTPKAVSIFESVQNKSKTMRQLWDHANEEFQPTPYSPIPIKVGNCSYNGYSTELVDEAIQLYRKDFKKAMDKYNNGN